MVVLSSLMESSSSSDNTSVKCPSCHTVFRRIQVGSQFDCSNCGAMLRVPHSSSDSAAAGFTPNMYPRVRLPGLEDVAAARRLQTQNQTHGDFSSDLSSFTPAQQPQTQIDIGSTSIPVIPPRPERIRVQIPTQLQQNSNVSSFPSGNNNEVFVVPPPEIEIQGSETNSSSSISETSNFMPRSPSPIGMVASAAAVSSPNQMYSGPNQMDSGPSSDSESSLSPSSPIPNQEQEQGSSNAYGFRRNSPVRKKSNVIASPNQSQNQIMEQQGSSNNKQACHNCSKSFNLLKRWKHKCRSCKRAVCSNCSRGKWPPQMLPLDYNYKNEKALRVCTTCQDHTEQFRRALLTGNLSAAMAVYSTGVVQLHCPYQIYPEKMYPMHCAAYSGSIDTLRWLLSKGCSPNVYDARGYTPLSVAAVREHQHMVKLFVFENISPLKQITDARVLQLCLANTFNDLFVAEKKLKRLAVGQEICVPKTKEEEEIQLRLALRESAGEDVKNEILECVSEGIVPGYTDISEISPEGHAKESEAKDDYKDDDCIVCFERTIDCVFLPCGHISCCHECADQFQECPVCRSKVEQVVKTYRS